MNIGILTFHFSENYGALFQAYALRERLLQLGHSAEFINYHPDYVEEGGSIDLKKPFTKSNLKNLYLKLIKVREKFIGNKVQKSNFEYFRRDSLGISGAKFKNKYEIENANINYDLIICGSDQIWNPPEQFGVDPVYFLDFNTLNGKSRKISYAPSFGKDSLDAQYANTISDLITKLDGVSVREESGCQIVKNLTGYRPISVPDPTILLTSYEKIMKPYQLHSDKHIFCYALRSRELIGDIAEKISTKFACPIYSPYNQHRRWREIGETVFPCPRQWLFLLTNAEFVITNSFHGTALSILQNKQFIVVGLQGKKQKFNARVKNLLEALGLMNRFISEYDKELIDRVLEEQIDWETVNGRVAELRAVGNDFLEEQLSICNEKGK